MPGRVCSDTRSIFGGRAEVTEVSGTGIYIHTVYIKFVPNLIGVFDRVLMPCIYRTLPKTSVRNFYRTDNRGILWYVPYRTRPYGSKVLCLHAHKIETPGTPTLSATHDQAPGYPDSIPPPCTTFYARVIYRWSNSVSCVVYQACSSAYSIAHERRFDV